MAGFQRGALMVDCLLILSSLDREGPAIFSSFYKATDSIRRSQPYDCIQTHFLSKGPLSSNDLSLGLGLDLSHSSAHG